MDSFGAMLAGNIPELLLMLLGVGLLVFEMYLPGLGLRVFLG